MWPTGSLDLNRLRSPACGYPIHMMKSIAVAGMLVTLLGVGAMVPASAQEHAPESTIGATAEFGVPPSKMPDAPPATGPSGNCAIDSREFLNLQGCDLRTSLLQHQNLTGANMAYSKVQGNRLNVSLLWNANLTGADLTDVYGRSAFFDGANLTRANFSGADLRSAAFSKATISHTDFSGASLVNASFIDFGSTQIEDATFANADMTRVNLSYSTLSNVDFTGADLSGADLRGAVLDGTDLSQTNLTGTIMPDGTVHA